MPIFYSAVSRGSCVLAEYAVFAGNFNSVTKDYLSKAANSGRFTYTVDNHVFSFLAEDGYSEYSGAGAHGALRGAPHGGLHGGPHGGAWRQARAWGQGSGMERAWAPETNQHAPCCAAAAAPRRLCGRHGRGGGAHHPQCVPGPPAGGLCRAVRGGEAWAVERQPAAPAPCSGCGGRMAGAAWGCCRCVPSLRRLPLACAPAQVCREG
jgi:hypothetical protein